MIHKLHYITQQTPELSHIEAAENALQAGCRWIQLRVKDTGEAEVLKIAKAVKDLCSTYDAKIIVNDFPAIAAEINAYGLHLGLTDTSITDARKIVGQHIIIGGTANTYKDVVQRIHEGANYVGLGPYRFTNTKKKLSPVLGLAGIKEIIDNLKMHNLQIPIIAIGGIAANDIPLLTHVGVHGIAVSGTITFACNRKQTAQELYSLLDKAPAEI